MTREEVIEIIKETVTLNLDEYPNSYEIDLVVDGQVMETVTLDKESD